ncbi:benzoyl-CoA reductase/2-hydroxyglutaryl-CoA dehydratase subunit, BcrC/BadD/HgdB [Clostridium cylindrosporum DSM 605]|uniref:Benzoyl-CoA reductase/2-hydroxyglutaryl-CoA dehydratase subunit, BcrC/BadD/HgdB n=2 Tax=Clostridium cylindrosporum TaxID=1495 RepID=A0A0J8DA26_CLOCY|nr:benzoyl-CoA reductase/2-hydroxyglutaryl-CoA dehydratase subunit, BcrC/BadD/HgdB [Clostridium cylindrosporum DSM 605]
MEMPKEFESFAEARKNNFLNVKAAKDAGKKVVGTYCTYTPWEIIDAAGAMPISVCSVSDETVEDAEKHLPKNLCPLIKASYGFAITDKCPFIYFADMIVGETTCDGKKKMYELLGEIKNVHVMQLPHRQNDPVALSLWKGEMIKLKEKLEKDFGVVITEEAIKKSIKVKNEQRNLLKEIYSLSKLDPPPISGYEMHKIFDATNFVVDVEAKNNELREMISGLQEVAATGNSPVSKDSKRILITGCPSGGVAEKVVKTVEEVGGVVVCFENCSGIKEKCVNVDETKDVYDALAEKYLSIPCSVMSPNTGRMELLDELIEEYKVDGVIDITLQACHTYAVESFSVKKVCNENKVGFMNLETNYSSSDVGQVRTRLEAFIEML